MKKSILTEKDLVDWMDSSWNLYASQMVHGNLLRFKISYGGSYKVTHGHEILYEDGQMTQAIAAWNAV